MVKPPAQVAPETSYDPGYFSPLFEAEDRHFWFRSRNGIIASLARQIVGGLPEGFRFLEIGCGTGNVLKALAPVCERGMLVGMDLYAEGLRFARRRVSSPLLQADLCNPPFHCQIDVIGMFDVLEHIPDDLGVLKDLWEMLANNGALILTVPAFQSLFSYFDLASHHVRRYDLAGLSGVLLKAGFKIEYIGYYMATLFPIVWLGRKLAVLNRRKTPLDDKSIQELSINELKIIPVINGLLSWVLALETGFITRHKQLPFGTSLICVARKQTS
jgi:SAM-dependent methyltransferase